MAIYLGFTLQDKILKREFPAWCLIFNHRSFLSGTFVHISNRTGLLLLENIAESHTVVFHLQFAPLLSFDLLYNIS